MKPARSIQFATKHPDLCLEWHPIKNKGLLPTQVSFGSNKKAWWVCSHCAGEWEMAIKSRSNGRGCPSCSKIKKHAKLSKPKPNLALTDTHPQIAKQADGWDAREFSQGSGKQMQWKCDLGHKWLARIADRSNGSDCPYCSGNKVLIGFNDLATIDPALATEAHNWDPTKITANAGGTHEWKCARNHVWKAPVKNRSRGSGCPFCWGRKAWKGFNDLATSHPNLAAEVDGWDPTTLTFGSHKQVGWKCASGHKWKASVNSRTNSESGCPYCSGNKVLIGFNDLATIDPALATEAKSFDPKSVTFGSNRKFAWICSLGHEFKASVKSRRRGEGCPVCAGKVVLIGFNDLASKFPDIAAEADGWNPAEFTQNSGKKVPWLCGNGHGWKATINNRTGSGHGCPVCAITGFNPGKASWLYFIEKQEIGFLQIGITNELKQRLAKHEKGGWSLLEVRGPMDGHLTQQLETSCLKALERRGAIMGHKAGIEKFDGYSEAWTKASLNVTSIKQILDWVYEDEGNS
jgi:hypothetical protein